MFSETLLRFFPPPAYLSPRVAGISFSDNHIRALVLDSHHGHLSVDTHVVKEVPVGAIESGIINQNQEIVALLKQIKSAVGTSTVRVSIPEERGYIFEVRIPTVTPEEVRSAIEFRLEENVPVSADKLAYHVIPSLLLTSSARFLTI